MKINAHKITDGYLLQRACWFTSGKYPQNVNKLMDNLCKAEHSPIRTQMYWVEMFSIPTFVSVHLVRHHVGVVHFVHSNRDDLGGDGEADRNTPINHAMLINAQGLIDMTRKRLCGKAHVETRKVMKEIKSIMELLDPIVAKYMVRNCEYRGMCPEVKSCGEVYAEFVDKDLVR